MRTKISEDLYTQMQQLVDAYVTETCVALSRKAQKPGKTKHGRSADAEKQARRSGADVLQLEEKVLSEIKNNPGQSAGALARSLGLGGGALYRRLDSLRTQGRIRAVGAKRFTKYYPQ